MTHEEIRATLRELEKRERAERSRLLESHNEKFRQERRLLQELCEEAGGHKHYALPDNGINAPKMFTGEWPTRCAHCGQSGWK